MHPYPPRVATAFGQSEARFYEGVLQFGPHLLIEDIGKLRIGSPGTSFQRHGIIWPLVSLGYVIARAQCRFMLLQQFEELPAHLNRLPGRGVVTDEVQLLRQLLHRVRIMQLVPLRNDTCHFIPVQGRKLEPCLILEVNEWIVQPDIACHCSLLLPRDCLPWCDAVSAQSELDSL